MCKNEKKTILYLIGHCPKKKNEKNYFYSVGPFAKN